MQLTMTQMGLIEVAEGCTSIGTSTVPFLANSRLKLVNNSTVTLNNGTSWGSVSAFIGGYTGYGDGTMTFTAPYTPGSGGVAAISNTAIFRPTDAVTPQNMWGAVLTDSGSTSVFAAGRFDAPPLPMTNALDQIEMSIVFNPATSNFGCNVVS
jgi:hypothetical protein